MGLINTQYLITGKLWGVKAAYEGVTIETMTEFGEMKIFLAKGLKEDALKQLGITLKGDTYTLQAGHLLEDLRKFRFTLEIA